MHLHTVQLPFWVILPSSVFCNLELDLRRRLEAGGPPLLRTDSDPFSRVSGRLVPLRSDSTSSVDSRSSLCGGREGVAGAGAGSDRKHGRKPQLVYCGGGGKREGEERREGRGRRDSLSVSVDWGSLPSGLGMSNGGSSLLSVTPTNPAPSTTLAVSSSQAAVGGGRMEEATPSAIVSLPLVYSAARAEAMENAESASPPNHTHQASVGGAYVEGSHSQRPGFGAGDVSGTVTNSPQKMKTHPLPVEALKPVLANGEATPLKRERGVSGGSDQEVLASGGRGKIWFDVVCTYV